MSLVLVDGFLCLRFFVASANVSGGFLSVDFHLYFFKVGAVRSGSLSVGVAHQVTGHFAFTANCTYFRHIHTSVQVE